MSRGATQLTASHFLPAALEEGFQIDLHQLESLPDFIALSEDEKKIARESLRAESDAFYEKEYGAKPSEIGYTSFGPVIKIMLGPGSETFGPFDILWAILALWTAWGYAKGGRDDEVVQTE